jgi:hypothetical protein
VCLDVDLVVEFGGPFPELVDLLERLVLAHRQLLDELSLLSLDLSLNLPQLSQGSCGM